MDKEIRRDMKGMSKAEQKAYLMEYMGWTDDDPPSESDDFWEPSEDESYSPF